MQGVMKTIIECELEVGSIGRGRRKRKSKKLNAKRKK